MRVLNEQWEDSLRDERYPFAGTGEVLSTTDQTLHPDVILDLNLMVDAATTAVDLDRITVVGGIVTATFTANAVVVGTLQLWPAPAAIVPVMNGTLVVGYARLDPLVAEVTTAWLDGEHPIINTQILPHLLVVSDKRWRQGFELPDGTVLTGDVYLVADREVWFERTLAGFAVHVTGDPFAGRTAPSRGLKTLNGIAPDASGNINLIGISTGNIVAGLFVAAGAPFRISLTPGSGSLSVELIGSGGP